MGRKTKSAKRQLLPDVRYQDAFVSRFINNLMHDGKKSTAEGVFYAAMDIIGDKIKDNEPIDIFRQGMDNVRPLLEVRARRVGGANYQIPVDVRPERRQALAIRWMLAAARARHEKSMAARLAAEFMDAANNSGTAVKKKEDTHRMAEANKAFSHYRW